MQWHDYITPKCKMDKDGRCKTPILQYLLSYTFSTLISGSFTLFQSPSNKVQ